MATLDNYVGIDLPFIHMYICMYVAIATDYYEFQCKNKQLDNTHST